ncbi:hypothetical protein ABB37_04340 [Leptomonas pyrrhocoris]|uniref:RING-type E3 ubiquitin transferase n=1 Tax=Leptomonas pyrrhocoris TaxID=157538 RepID=A0A0M9G2L4_LEPPY|nr:hypothetical protein ABB37_04340 [Leptomonas pyrrhocoris]KPA80947.1 hypothetical protein ABB37_04340 [Leptomonas pyrrhocoris]|eukprot:XP_015659386.1 hypothetical protein ABB37_04340 [Leptomonas pyrrhocoris]
MPSNCTSTEVFGNTEEQYVAHGLCKNEKAQPFEMVLEDPSNVAEAADVSSQPSTPSSGGRAEATDVTGSPLRNATTTDEKVGRYPATPCSTTPVLLPTHRTCTVKLSSSAPSGCSPGLLGARIVVQPEKQEAHRESENRSRTPQPSPSPRRTPTTATRAAATTPTTAAVTTKPPVSPEVVPRTPSPVLKRSPANTKAAATSPTLRTSASPPSQRDGAEAMPARETSALPSPMPELPPVAIYTAPSPPPVRSTLAPSPRAPPALDEEPDVCCICLEEYSDDNPMFRGECQHHFHLACLMEWKQRSNSCPMCCAETLRGVGDLQTPRSSAPVDPAEAARLREIAAQDEAFAHRLQRKYLQRAQQQQQQQQQQRRAGVAMRASPTMAPARSPQQRPQRSATLLPPLTTPPRSASQQASYGSRQHRTRSGGPVASPAPAADPGTPAVTATPPTRVSDGTTPVTSAVLPKREKARKPNGMTPTRASPLGSRQRSTSPAVHPQFQSGQRPQRRSGQGGCTMM